jgi:hypothetical protein
MLRQRNSPEATLAENVERKPTTKLGQYLPTFVALEWLRKADYHTVSSL